jgi:hypothetical protein
VPRGAGCALRGGARVERALRAALNYQNVGIVAGPNAEAAERGCALRHGGVRLQFWSWQLRGPQWFCCAAWRRHHQRPPARATHLVVLVPVHRYLRLNQYEPRGCDKCTDDYTGPLFIPGCCARSNLDSCAVVDVANVIALLVIVPVRVAFLLLAPTPILLKVV